MGKSFVYILIGGLLAAGGAAVWLLDYIFNFGWTV